MRPPNPTTYDQLWGWANRLLVRFEFLDFAFCKLCLRFVAPCVVSVFCRATLYPMRRLLGPDIVIDALRTHCIHIDSWFTGCDFPHFALEQIAAAVRRRQLNQSQTSPNVKTLILGEYSV